MRCCEHLVVQDSERRIEVSNRIQRNVRVASRFPQNVDNIVALSGEEREANFNYSLQSAFAREVQARATNALDRLSGALEYPRLRVSSQHFIATFHAFPSGFKHPLKP